MQKDLTPQIAAMYIGFQVNTAYGVGQISSVSMADGWQLTEENIIEK